MVLIFSTETITGNRKVKINYSIYETTIVEAHSIKIVGWPKDINFVNPSGIGTVGEIHKLHDALKSGECHWVKLTRAELAKHTQELTERQQQGETVGKPRKKRLDARTSRKRKERPSDNQENERPS